MNILSFNFYGQPGSEDIPQYYEFKFYDSIGKIISPRSLDYKIKIDYNPYKHNHKDSLIFVDNKFICKSHFDSEIKIEIVSQKDTMKINTVTSLDSIPFLIGKYKISNETKALFSIKTNKSTKIDKKNWNYFKENDSTFQKKPDTLKSAICKFWKNYKKKIKNDDKPELIGIYNNNFFSNKIYAWDWNNVYESSDNCANWTQIFTTKQPYETPILSFKDKKTLIIVIKNKNRKDVTSNQREVYVSRNKGINWKLDVKYTAMRMSFVYFKNKNEGFAFCDKYDITQKQMKTVAYTTKNSGKTWKRNERLYSELLPRRTISWINDNIVLESGSFIYYSSDNGENWYILNKDMKYSKFTISNYPTKYTNNLYPSLASHNDFTILKRNNNFTLKSEILLKIDNYYTYLTASQNTWCLSGSGYTLITKNNGELWNFYTNSIGNTFLFEIIDNKYIFNGEYIYSIN